MNLDPSTRPGSRWFRQSEVSSLTKRTTSRIGYMESDEGLVREADAAVRAHWEKNPPGSEEHPWLVPAMIVGIGPARLQEFCKASGRDPDSFLRDFGIFAVSRAIAVAGHPALIETLRMPDANKPADATPRVLQHLLPLEWSERIGRWEARRKEGEAEAPYMIASATHHRLVGAVPEGNDSDSGPLRSVKFRSRYACEADSLADVPLLPTVAPSGEDLARTAVVVAWFACDFLGDELFRDRWEIRKSGLGIELVGREGSRRTGPVVGFAIVGVDSYGMLSAELEESPLVLGIDLAGFPPGVRHAIRNVLASEFPSYLDPRAARRSRGRFRVLHDGTNHLVDLVVLARKDIEALAAGLDPAALEAYRKFVEH